MSYFGGKQFFSIFTENICEKPHTEGTLRCRAAKDRFWFNNETKKCQKIIYGGCGESKNNFITMEECQAACEKTA